MVSQHHSWFGLTAGIRRVLVMLAFACLGQPGDALALGMSGPLQTR